MIGILIFFTLKAALDFYMLKYSNIKFECIYFVLFCLMGIGIIQGASSNAGVCFGIAAIVYAVIWMGISYLILSKKNKKSIK